MKFKYLIYLLIFGIIAYLLFGLLNMYVGWYARKPWKNRIGTSEIQESKKRNIFIK